MKGICLFSTAPVRAEAAHRSEMTNQLLFGDTYHIIAQHDNWARISSDHDGYEGWLDKQQISPLSETEYQQIIAAPKHIALDIANTINTEGMRFLIPIGSTLPNYNAATRLFSIDNRIYRYNGKTIAPIHPATPPNPQQDAADKPNLPQNDQLHTQIVQFAKKYLHTPYLWGGRSPFGIDCSGFTQVCAKLCGISIQRDAHQQALQGNLITHLNQAQLGDLAFFSPVPSTDRITHVGIICGRHHIIHASGEVRIDTINEQGIFNHPMKNYTHCLKTLRRLL